MKHYIMITLIILNLINTNLYATNSFFKQYNIDSTTHSHHHLHNASKHSHKHSHNQVNVSVLDFYTDIDGINKFSDVESEQKYLEKKYFILNPLAESLFRPPIV